MPRPTESEIRALVAEVLAELAAARATPAPTAHASAPLPHLRPTPPAAPGDPAAPPARPGVTRNGTRRAGPDIDLPDPTTAASRGVPAVTDPANAAGLANLVASTTARIGVGRAGPRPRTASLLLFQSDHAVTQDAIFGDVPSALLDQFGLFTVQSQVSDQEEFLLRPDLGRKLAAEGRALVEQRCTKAPNVQIVVGDGLSAAAIANNLDRIYPVLTNGFAAAGLSLGTPFFVRYCRVGIINDINEIVQADAVVLLIGERPGLGVADALSVYSGYRPGPGKSDAHRDVVCMITEHGGTNPLEAGAYVVEHIRTVLAEQASGVELRLKQRGER